MTTSVTITTRDDQTFCVPAEPLWVSGLLSSMMNFDDDDDDDDDDGLIPLPNVDGSIFQLVLDFCEHHLQDPQPTIHTPIPKGATPESVLGQGWYSDFITNLTFERTLELQAAASYLEVDVLSELMALAVALHFTQTDWSQITSHFDHCPAFGDMTEEEQTKIRQDMQWVSQP